MMRLPARRQRGATLLVAMVFLIVLMLIVASAVKVTNVNTRVVGNAQTEKEADAAAQKAIEEVISYDFAMLPVSQDIEVDINNSGQSGSTYEVTVVPTCIAVQPIKTVDLDVANEQDQACFASSAAQNTGIVGAIPSGNSLCSESIWNIEATVTPPHSSQAATTLTQGVSQRVDQGANC